MEGLSASITSRDGEQLKVTSYELRVYKITMTANTMRFLKITLQTVLFIFFVYAAFILLTSRVSVFGIQSMVVLTGSMEPTIPVGSIVFIKADQNYQEKAIITFTNKAGTTVTHRLVEKTDSSGNMMFRTKGDANEQPDSELVSPRDVLGKSILFIPYLGRMTQFLKTTPGFIGLIVVPALIFIGYEFLNIKREIEKITEKRVLEKVKAEN